MTKLSVNVNKLATLRNSRGKNNPDVLKTSLDIISYGAQGITVHPRPDARHIRKDDVFNLAKHINVELNIEGYPDDNFLEMVKAVKPAQCTLVPDAPNVLTSNAGWDVAKNVSFLQKVVQDLQSLNIRTSLFIDPFQISENEIGLLKTIGPQRVELYTEAYAENYNTQNGAKVLAVYKDAALALNQIGIALNAGHDLNLDNLSAFVKAIPSIEEVSIGHALICDALYFGLEETISRYLACLK
jgi:pyridoxine 5-phosphate synthase